MCVCVCVCVPVELQYVCDRAEDNLDVGVAENGSVGVQSCSQRLLVHLHHTAGSILRFSNLLFSRLDLNGQTTLSGWVDSHSDKKCGGEIGHAPAEP